MVSYNTLELDGTTEWDNNLKAYVWKGKVWYNGDLAEVSKGSNKYTWGHCSLHEVLDYFSVGKNGQVVLVTHLKENKNAI